MCLTFHIRVVHFICMLKYKSIYTKYLCLFSQKKIFPGLRNLGAQIRCVQNRYTAVQTEHNLKFYICLPGVVVFLVLIKKIMNCAIYLYHKSWLPVSWIKFFQGLFSKYDFLLKYIIQTFWYIFENQILETEKPWKWVTIKLGELFNFGNSLVVFNPLVPGLH